MSLFLVFVLMVLPLESLGQNHEPQDGTYLVTIVYAGCDPTRRVRCRYKFESISENFSTTKIEEKKIFGFLFYQSADQIEEQGKKVDALTRLDINYKEPVKLEILGTRYKFIRKDEKNIEVDTEKKIIP